MQRPTLKIGQDYCVFLSHGIGRDIGQTGLVVTQRPPQKYEFDKFPN